MSRNNKQQIFDNSEINFLIKRLKEATIEEEEEKNAVNWNQLKKSARYFLRSYNILETQGEQLNAQMLRSIINLKDSLNVNYLNGLRGKLPAYIIRSKYLLAFKFDKDLTAFLNNAPKSTLYVFEDDNGNLSTFEMPMSELARRISGQERIKMTINQLTAENKKSIEQAKEKEKGWKDHVAQASAAYQGTINRLSYYYAAVNRTGNEQKGGLLMYKISQEWTVARILNKGDIKEAYASVIMTEHQKNLSNNDPLCSVNKGAPPEYSEQLIASFHQNYIEKVTNQAAIVAEDIVAGNRQYAVKAENSGTPGLLQYLTVAIWIANQSNTMKRNEVQKYIEEAYPQDAARNIILQEGLKIGDVIDDKLNLDDLSKTYIYDVINNGWKKYK